MPTLQESIFITANNGKTITKSTVIKAFEFDTFGSQQKAYIVQSVTEIHFQNELRLRNGVKHLYDEQKGELLAIRQDKGQH